MDSTFYLIHYGTCKSLKLVPVYLYDRSYMTVTGVRIRERSNDTTKAVARKPFLAVHGNVMYDFYYQSNADTPFVERDIHQHTLQTTLDITVRDQYPLRLSFSTSKSNSLLLRSITGLNLQYSNRDFKNAVLNKAQQWDAGRLKEWKDIEGMKLDLDEQRAALAKLRGWLSAPAQIQRLVEARERQLYGQLPKADVPEYNADMLLPLKAKGRRLTGGLIDSSWYQQVAGKYEDRKSKRDNVRQDFDTSYYQRIVQDYDKQKAKLDSMQKAMASLEQKYDKRLEAYGIRRDKLVDVLLKKKNIKELTESLEALNIPDTVLPKGYKTMLALRSVGLGRTMVDYSELTAKHISIIGAQVEFNPSWYIAFASGAVDYRFRDFIVNQSRNRQYLNIMRVGMGMKDGNNVILSFYTGRKQAYNFSNPTPGNPDITVPDSRIMGMSVEGKWQLNHTTFITGEVAKSSLPSQVRVDKQGMMGSMLRFDDHSNEAYAITANTMLPSTQTKLSGMYKLMGANFQSFSLYPSGSKQTGWLIRADQPFFRQQLTISASVRKNAYTSVFESSGYMSNTVFASLQATFRRRHWPVLTLGYFPSSQLVKLGEDKFMENMFYTLTGTASHFYQYRHISMNTMFSGMRFYNRQADSNFVYFNSTNLLLNQTVFLGRLTVNGGLSSATNQDYALYGADGNVQYKFRSWLEAGGGLKYNYQTVYEKRQLGYSGNVRVQIPKIGEVRLMADQSFIPGVERQLVPNKTGRVTYTKIF